MKKIIIFCFGFVAGGLASLVASKEYYKKDYESKTQEALDSIRNANKKKQEESSLTKEKANQNEPTNKKDEVIGRNSEIEPFGKLSYEERTERYKSDSPYIIPPEEYGETGYDVAELTYYSDGIITDSMDQIVHDFENVIGADALKHFGEYEDDSVFVRNDTLQCDYQILLNLRPYGEAVS